MGDSTPTEATDAVVELPLVREVTVTEAHSALLGLVGVLAGAGFRLGFVQAVGGFTVCVVTIAFGLRKLSGDRIPVAVRVVRREPWYFLVVYVATAAGSALAWPLVG